MQGDAVVIPTDAEGRIPSSAVTAIRSAIEAFAPDRGALVLDICEAEGADPRDVADGPAIRALCDRIADSRVETIARVSGKVSGCALAVAFACRRRQANAAMEFRSDDVALGEFPVPGTIDRLVRAAGPAVALDLLVGGRRVDAAAARAAGLIDGLAAGDAAVSPAAWSMADREAAVAAFEARHGRRLRGDPVARAVVALVASGNDEAEAAARVGATDEARAIAYLRRSERVAATVAAGAPRPIVSVAVIGAGTMGAGIALCFIDAGFAVTLIDTGRPALDRGVARIEALQAADVAKGRTTAAAAAAARARLLPSTDMAMVADADLIVEAVFEDIAVKTALFAQLDTLAKPASLLASNTSFLDLDAIAGATTRPESVFGLHFFSPANVMRLLEVVRAARTDPALAATGIALGRRLGKVPVLVGACFGFVGNRMLAHRQREAMLLVEQGVAPWDVDRVLKAFGFAMGPFEMSDLAGLDLGWKPGATTDAGLRDTLCEHGRFGQKNGAGYYDYDANRRATPSPVTERLIAEFVARRGTAPRAADDAEILDRCILPIVNEGARILEEGIAQRASDIDVVWANGYGWPLRHGGPMYHADRIGLPTLAARLDRLAMEHGEAFIPAPLIRRLAAQGGSFTGG